ncbi:FKBP-type peptidyl-prolyl cis-trans isomerase [Magnetospirillum moscoviense]|uniref:FKBP-type peptidyl-prolyl cis-trans isomerase n=1 Tax=Magnetospirillum moscoviense TaxID=1437059 RepID=UPI0009EEBCF7|nr:peptidylprolyl isomerase [Magnetospirillum moscoviense]
MSARIQPGQVVTLAYSVRGSDGHMVDEGRDPLVYVHGGHDAIFPRIEEALEGKVVGDTLTIRLSPEDAFGDYDAGLVTLVDLAELPADAEPGMQIEATPTDGGESVLYTVTEIAEGKAVLDGNHPLAGMDLLFSCEVKAIRPATEDEKKAGHIS